jgi:hypothetical protein
MRRLLATLNAALAAGSLFGTPRSALAQNAPAPLACEPMTRELNESRIALDRALTELERARAAARDAQSAKAELERARSELAANAAAVQSCQAARQQLCASAGAFASSLSSGHVSTAGVDECIAPNDRRELAQQLSGWSHASSVLSQLGAYSAGETDAAPRLGPFSGTRAEKLIARLLYQSNGSPLVYRRLLIEALELIAPVSFNLIRSTPAGVEKWFASDDPMDERIVAEARAGISKPAAGVYEAAPLTTALQLVSAYQLVARCSSPNPARDCKRAAELRQVLETSGPLVARRRIQDVWAASCSSLNEGVGRQWLAALPLSQLSAAEVHAIGRAVHAKLLTCFLRDSTAGSSLPAWAATKLPRPEALTSGTLPLLREVELMWHAGSTTDRCVRAVRALQTLEAPRACSLPATLGEPLRAYAAERAADTADAFELVVCDRFAHALWAGAAATIPDSFPGEPTVEDVVRTREDTPHTNVQTLRTLCRERAGQGRDFETSLRALASIAQSFGEDPANEPWKLDARSLEPVEKVRSKNALATQAWLRSLAASGTGCRILELGDARCRACKDSPADAHYDCSLLAEVKAGWVQRTRTLVFRVLGLLAFAAVAFWAFRLRRALRRDGSWLKQATGHLRSIELDPKPDRLRYVFPSSMGNLRVALPRSPAWERWGSVAAVVRSHRPRLQDRDVNRAAATAQAMGAELALLVHDEGVSPDLGAVRAMLEWAARGGTRAVQVLPLPWTRLEWARGSTDLLELAEESSLRSNPFDVRGRITSSTQFFNRERLVSALLADAQAGHFVVVTGLRRFGKSSLALEVARRLPGPSAYVDLAGFHHEIRFLPDPASAVDAILRFVCLKLTESLRTSYPGRTLTVDVPEGPLDTTTLAVWFRNFFRALGELEPGKALPVLLILDEIEQAIGAARELNRALDVLAILVGRLRNSLPGTADARGQRVGVLFCSALHPLLWSPLGTLAHQSLVGSFEYVSVPCLPEEAAISMMRGLGSRQGIRFTDAAVRLLVDESQGVPLLVRRLGSAVLELYDPDRARQGALGAVEVGVEGVRAAIEREEAEGSPLRVWIESEIAEAASPGGAVLRYLAQRDIAPATELRAIAAQAFRSQFEITGVALALTTEERLRRVQEASAVVVRMLGDAGLLIGHGDPTEPEAYELPDGIIRRVLRRNSVHPPPSADALSASDAAARDSVPIA